MKYEVVDKESLNCFQSDLKAVYGLEPSTGLHKSKKSGRMIPYIRLRSIHVYNDLMRYAAYRSHNWHIGKEVLYSQWDKKKEFLRALFDDEGSVIPYGKSALVRLYSINQNGLLQIQEMLSKAKINSKIVSGFGHSRNVYALTIRDLTAFCKIGFNLSRKQKRLEEFLKK